MFPLDTQMYSDDLKREEISEGKIFCPVDMFAERAKQVTRCCTETWKNRTFFIRLLLLNPRERGERGKEMVGEGANGVSIIST